MTTIEKRNILTEKSKWLFQETTKFVNTNYIHNTVGTLRLIFRYSLISQIDHEVNHFFQVQQLHYGRWTQCPNNDVAIADKNLDEFLSRLKPFLELPTKLIC